ncbi:MAG TPA: HDOD domain-containing protein [Anaerolineaceae bacterium]|nr:HDOD domain-containing protein [Anaerolineaceae bacterium]HPN51825.1 HDOD domain-containing protein [Anaerolineaceae bacterium]
MSANKEKTIAEILERADTLPPLPMVAKKALRLISTEGFSMKELANILASDQAIASKLLLWANSSYYGANYPISTIHQAVTYLGEKTVRSLILTAAFGAYLDRSLPGYCLDRGALWEHSIGMAVAARLVTRKFGLRVAEEAYTAGLLCDVGKLAIETSLRDINPDDTEWAGQPFSEFEKAYLGIDHARLGAELARRWGFPLNLQEAICFHHEPSQASKEAVLPSAVHVADILIMMLGIGIGRDGLQYSLDPFAMQRLELKEPDLEKLLSQTIASLKEAKALLGFEI